VVEALAPVRSRQHAPLAQVLFVYHTQPRHVLALDGLRCSDYVVPGTAVKYELALHMAEEAGGLVASFGYDTALFDADSIAALAADFSALLTAAVAAPDRRLGVLPRAAIAAPVPACAAAGATLLTALAAVVEERGEELAVSDGERCWSYGELWCRAGAVAGQLQAAVGTGERAVGLLLGQDAVMVAGLLGVLRAGGHYVPLDPYAPAARQRELLRDAGAVAVVSTTALAAAAPWLGELGLPVLGVADAAPAGDSAPLAVVVSAASPVYLLYTSGTCGRPKGVVQTQGGVLGQVGTWSRQLQLGPADRVALLSGYGYDAAVQDIFGALLSGASLHPLDLRAAGSGPELVDQLVREGVTVLHATPTVYRHLFAGRVTCAQDLSRVRLVVLGGEAARRSDFELFKLRFPRGTRLVNGLGLTECSTALQFFADHDTRICGEWLPVGQPVPGMGVRLVGADGADSWIGELVLDSAWLGHYHRPSAEEAARFTELPDGTRRYRTGDRLRRLPDGQYVHAGRLDRQVQLRGIRLEPQEIEAALSAVAGVTDAHVTVRDTASGEAQLTAWVAGTHLSASDLRAALRELLPPTLVPGLMVTLPALPRRANGKRDDDALQALARSAELSAGGSGATEPTLPADTALIAQLTALWAGVLKRSDIGPTDDFFALGGHSLLATRLIARVRDACQVELPLLALFEAPTIAGMAARITALRATRQPLLPPIRRQARAHGDER
jgi:amino acid adenylation domain-containing protein